MIEIKKPFQTVSGSCVHHFTRLKPGANETLEPAVLPIGAATA
jgi:hypothetical protein